MDHSVLIETLVGLASQAADLSNNLYATGETTNQTGTDIESMANEIAILSAVLWRLHEEITKDQQRYTEAFMQDLDEITRELTAIFEEVSEVAKQLSKVDKQQQGAIKTFFRKSKIGHLQKHLEALKTTLVVMRTVLQHGKEYGAQKSGTIWNPGRLSGSEPHVMFEDRTILDSVIKTNRDAILNLQEVEERHNSSAATDGHQRKPSSEPPIPPIPEAFVPSTPRKLRAVDPTFSQRGVRLGVHRSILDMGPQSAPDTLKNKWIQTSRAHPHRPRHSSSGGPRPSFGPYTISPTKPPQTSSPRHDSTAAAADKTNISPRQQRLSKSSFGGQSPVKTTTTAAAMTTHGGGGGGGGGWTSRPMTETLSKVLPSSSSSRHHHRKQSSLTHTENMDAGELTALPQIED